MKEYPVIDPELRRLRRKRPRLKVTDHGKEITIWNGTSWVVKWFYETEEEGDQMIEAANHWLSGWNDGWSAGVEWHFKHNKEQPR